MIKAWLRATVEYSNTVIAFAVSRMLLELLNMQSPHYDAYFERNICVLILSYIYYCGTIILFYSIKIFTCVT